MDFLASQGAGRNFNGGVYVSGAAYGREKKIEVAEAYMRGLTALPRTEGIIT